MPWATRSRLTNHAEWTIFTLKSRSSRVKTSLFQNFTHPCALVPPVLRIKPHLHDRVLTYVKSGTDSIISAVYSDNWITTGSTKNWLRPALEGCVYTIPFGGLDLFLIWEYGTANAISEIITQANIRIKKLVQWWVFSGCKAIDVHGPKPVKMRVGTHLKK